MKVIFKFSTVVFLLLILIGLLLITFLGGQTYRDKGASIKFVNSSGQNIDSVEIIVSGEKCSAQLLRVNGELNCHFKNLAEGSYSVSVSLEDGKVLHEPNIGYVTSGFTYNDIVTINEAGEIELLQKTGT